MFQVGQKVSFNLEGKVQQGMYLRTIKWEDEEAYYQIQMSNGNRISVPVSEDVQSVEDQTYVYPGNDCQV